jgi:hypothetical protein
MATGTANRVNRLFKGSRGLVAGILIGATVTLVTVAGASGSSSPEVFYGCLKGGTLSKVQLDKSHSCPSGAKKVNWSQAGPLGATGPRGVPGPKGNSGATGPSAISALAGKPCTFDGQASTTALTQNAVTGAFLLTCSPVAIPFSATVSGGTMGEILLSDGAIQHMCDGVASCNFTFTAGDNLKAQFLSGRLDTGGGSPFTTTCPAGWTGSGAANEVPAATSGFYYVATCAGTAVTTSTTSTAAFLSFSASVTGGTMGEILLTDQGVEHPACDNATSCGPFIFASGDNLSALFLSGRLDTGGGSPFTATCPAGWTGSGAATAVPGSTSGIYYVANCADAGVTTSATSNAAF